MSKRGDPRTFAKNLRRLNALADLSPPNAAKAISKQQSVKIEPKWYRRLCLEGIGQVHQNAKQRLTAIAKFFGVTTVNQLWDDKLIVFNLSKFLVPPTEAEYTVKLVQLLETKKHDYLRHLITSLHGMEFPDGVPEPNEEEHFRAEFFNHGDEDVEEDEEDDNY